MAQHSYEPSGEVLVKSDTSSPCTMNEYRQDSVTNQTTFESSPITTLATDTLYLSRTGKDPEKQSFETVQRISWPRRFYGVILSIGHPRKVRLSTESAQPCSDDTSESGTSILRFQSEPRLKVETVPFGYPRLAAFQASDEAFSIYRGFAYIHARVLSDLQYDISDLEQRLMDIDKDDGSDDEGCKRLISRDNDDQDARDYNDSACERRRILAQLQEKLLKYDEILLKAKEIATLQRPNQSDYNSVANWFDKHKPLVESEWYSLQQQDDMITLRHGREWAMFDSWVENLLRKLDPIFPPIGWIFRPERLQEQSSDPSILYYHSPRVEKLVAIIITAVVFVLLVIPVVLMYELTSIGNRSSTFDAIGVMVVFTLIFSAAMSLLTKAKRHELFGAAAAYCAVLVVFISNFGGQSIGNS